MDTYPLTQTSFIGPIQRGIPVPPLHTKYVEGDPLIDKTLKLPVDGSFEVAFELPDGDQPYSRHGAKEDISRRFSRLRACARKERIRLAIRVLGESDTAVRYRVWRVELEEKADV
jgi:hypothetical protein